MKNNTFVTHLECSMTGRRYEKDCVHGLSDAGKPLLVRYDLEKIKKVVINTTTTPCKILLTNCPAKCI